METPLGARAGVIRGTGPPSTRAPACRDRADQRDMLDPIGKGMSTRQRIRPARGVAHHAELLNPERAGQRLHIGRPVENLSTRLRIGSSVTRSVDGDQLDAKLLRGERVRSKHP